MKQKYKVKKSIISSLKWILAIILIIASLFIIIMGIGNKEKNIYANIEEVGNLDYQVYLKPNEYFTVPYLRKNERYISELIEKIQVQVSYELESTQKVDYKLQYRVDATLDVIQQEGNKEEKKIWSKQFVIRPSKQTTLTKQNKLIVKDEFTIDYPAYVKMVKTLQERFQIPLDASLKVKVYFDTTDNIKEKSFTKNSDMSLIIPLNKSTIDIIEEKNLSENSDIIYEENENIKNLPLLVIGCFLLSASTIVFVYYGLEFLKNSKEQYSYSKEKNRILRKYDAVIVNAKKVPDIKGLSMIEVSSFEELLDAEEELHIPIIFIEIISGAVGWFIIIHQNQVWRYVLKVKVK